MARIAYFEIQQAIADQIKNDTEVSAYGAQVVVEETTMPGRSPMVYVYLTNRKAPEEEQMICAGRRMVMDVYYSIWCQAYGYHMKDAIDAREELLRLVEEALMRNRTFGRDDVGYFEIEGGEFGTAKNDEGFNVGAEIALRVRASAIN
jgi:hypothetical protein